MAENKEQFLVPQDQYLKSGIHIGTKFKTRYMDQFIYKTRPDGLSVLNLQKIDERLKIVANLLAQYEPEDILIVSRRENGWKPLRKLKKMTGINIFAGRYPPGITTNANLEDFMEV
ncbi:30S ribosomal protein S2, partial [Candidatus Woesearchaeota archaeon]|nr:30S ribosomal protein S2 [Candidatus Woesearchaeota archaeon]